MLASLLRPERRWLLVGGIAMLINSIGSLTLPLAIERLLSQGAESRLLVGVALLCIASAVAAGARATAFGIAGERLVARLREQTFAGLLARPTAELDGAAAGALVSRLTRDAAAIHDIVSSCIGPLLRSVVLALGGMGLMIHLSPMLTLTTVLVLPPVFIATRMHGRHLRGLAADTSDAVADSTAHAEESLRQHRVVTLFRAQEAVRRAYGRRVRDAAALGERRARAQGLFAAGSVGGRFGGMALIIALGAHRVSAGDLTATALGTFMVYALMVAVAMGELAQGWAAIQRTLGAAERCLALIPQQEHRPSSTPLPPGPPRIRFEAVDFAYPSRPDVAVLRSLDLELTPGRTTAIVGPSGAGKSTLIDLVSALHRPDAGRVSWSGVDLGEADPEDLRARIAVVTQSPVLFDGDIAENLRLGAPDATEEEIWAALDESDMGDFVRALPHRLRTRIGPGGHALSGGQRQRLTLARALLAAPDLLILDEATSALDADCAASVESAIERLQRGRTVMLITHKPEVAQRADRIITLKTADADLLQVLTGETAA